MPSGINVNIGQPGSVDRDLDSKLADFFNIKDFGAVCNGTVTESGHFSGNDDTAAVQAACNAAGQFVTVPMGLSVDWDEGDGSNNNNLTQGVVYFPPGAIVRVDNTIDVPPGVLLKGNGSILIRTNTQDTPLLQFRYDPMRNGEVLNYTAASGNTIEDMTLWGPGASTSQGTGLLIANAQGFTVRNVLVGGFYVNLDVWASQYGKFDQFYSEGGVHCGIFRSRPTAAQGSNIPANRCIDMYLSSCRFAKSVGGYGLWLQHVANVNFKQLDQNFCTNVPLVLGSAVPDYISRTITITNSGSGYPPSMILALTISNSGQNNAGQLTAACVTDSSGKVVLARITDGIGDGSGVGTSVKVSLSASTGSGATFQLSYKRDGTLFSNLLDSPNGYSCGDVTINQHKIEVGSDAVPDAGYLTYCDSNSSANLLDTRYSSYGRSASATPPLISFYRWLFNAGGPVTLQANEFAGVFANPGLSTDYAYVRNVGTNTTTATMRFILPHETPLAHLYRYVIDQSGNPATAGEEVYLETTNGSMKYSTGVAIGTAGYGGNPALTVIQDGDSNPRALLDFNGALNFGAGGTSAPDVTLKRTGPGVLTLPGSGLVSPALGFAVNAASAPDVTLKRTGPGILTISGTEVIASALVLPSGDVQNQINQLAQANVRTVLDVSTMSGSFGAGFASLKFSTISFDTAGGFNMSTGMYTVPKAGYWQCTGKLRVLDGSTAGVSYGQGVGKTPGDNAPFQWFITVPIGARNGSLTTTLAHFAQGDQVSMYVYADLSNSLAIASAEMTLLYLGN